MIDPIINLYRTKEEAFYFKNSPLNMFYDFRGVHLLPNNPVAYVQVTNVKNGIDLEDWQVKIVGLCSGLNYDVTSNFKIEDYFTNLDGTKQIYWSLINVPYDFGSELAYLEITQTLGETFYSSPFIFTEEDKEWTTMFHYKDRKIEEYQSIGFKTWFREHEYKEEREVYYEVSTQNSITHSIKQHELQVYHTEKFAKSQIIQLAKVLGSSYLYVDLKRAYLYEPMELPRLGGQENYTKVPSYLLSFNNKDVLDPVAGLVIPDFDELDFNNFDFYT